MKKIYIKPVLIKEILNVETMLIGISDTEYNGEFDAKEMYEADEGWNQDKDNKKMSLW